MRKMCYEDFKKIEIFKIEQTKMALKGFYSILPDIYELFLQLPYHLGVSLDEKDQNKIKLQDAIQFFYYELPYFLRSIFMLLEAGNYNEGAILYRSLLEIYAVYKYFVDENNGDGLSEYVTMKKKINYKDIFESLSPNFYDNIYTLLSESTHSKPFIQAALRKQKVKDSLNIYGVNFDWYSYISNQIINLLPGIVEMYFKVYEKNTIASDKLLAEKLELVNNFVENDIKDRYKLYPGQRKIIEEYSLLTNKHKNFYQS